MTDVSDRQFELAQAEPSPLPSCESASATPPPDKPWPAVYALVMTWLGPATAGRRLLNVGLLKAFGIHIASGVILFFAATSIAALAEDHSPFELWGSIIDEVRRHPTEFAIGFSIFIGVIEGVALTLAFLLAPWGARDENMRSSLYHSTRTVWLQSMHVAVATLLWIVLIFCWEKMQRWAWSSGVNWADRSWYFRHKGEILSCFGCVLYGWALWGIIRAVGARPVAPPANAPPTCQGCGYNLTGTALEGLCPECGGSVSASIGPDARPGVPWERRGGRSWRQAWWETAGQTVRSPGRFGRDLQIYSPPREHRRFLLISMVASGAAGVLGAACWLLGFLSAHEPYYGVFDDFFWFIGPMTFIWTALAVLAFALLSAAILGVIFSFGTGRNVMPAAMRCACYLSGLLVFWVLANAAGAYVFGMSSTIELFDRIARHLRIDDESVALLGWGFFNVAGLSVYLCLFWAMLKGARYATR